MASNSTLALPPTDQSRLPHKSSTRLQFTDELLSNLSPLRALEAFTSQSWKLEASFETATEADRAFGVRAALASKKIQEWVDELKAWRWPVEGASNGFETPVGKRKAPRSSHDPRIDHVRIGSQTTELYIGSLAEDEVYRYGARIEEIANDMEELEVEQIKRYVLETHFSPRSRPSSSASFTPVSTLIASSRMDDFTAIVTATILQALPTLSKLVSLMNLWAVRLSILRKVTRVLHDLDDAEGTLKLAWQSIQVSSQSFAKASPAKTFGAACLSRHSFKARRDVLQSQVALLGQDLDHMLDMLEGRQDTLPDSWLDRMEAIERDYGEWIVAGEQRVREQEWARHAGYRDQEEVGLWRAKGTSVKDWQMDPVSEEEAVVAAEGLEAAVKEIDSGGRPQAGINAPRGSADLYELTRGRIWEPTQQENQKPEDATSILTDEKAISQPMTGNHDLSGDIIDRSVEGPQATTNVHDMGIIQSVFPCRTDSEHNLNASTKDTATAAETCSSTLDGLPSSFDGKQTLPCFRGSKEAFIIYPQTLSLPGLDVPSISSSVSLNITSPGSSPFPLIPMTPLDDKQINSLSSPGLDTPPRSPFDEQWDSPKDFKQSTAVVPPYVDAGFYLDETHGHNRSTSLISNYSSSDSLGEVQQAKTIAAFRSSLTPSRSSSRPLFDNATAVHTSQGMRSLFDKDGCNMTPSATPPSPAHQSFAGHIPIQSSSPVFALSCNKMDSVFKNQSSNQNADLPTTLPSRPSSRGSTIITCQFKDLENSDNNSSSNPGLDVDSSSYDRDEHSASSSRVKYCLLSEYSPPDSPSFLKDMPHRRQVSQTLSELSDSLGEAPVLDNVSVTNPSLASPRRSKSSDHLQQQIHSILTSIPNDIRLTTEPPSPSTADNLRPAKARRSSPSTYALSALSSRSPTPYLTLAPALSTNSMRTRSQSSNPEIKVYHLSRSTGEKPIKLFVRLVGEHGERVMVRVGGGWADLGEYLKEYAIHHGRRSASGEGEIEIRDLALPPSNHRKVGGSSATRGLGKTSATTILQARSASTNFDRPVTQLAIRKTRVSIGEANSKPPVTPRSSTSFGQLPGRETPDSGISARSSSRLSWTADDESSSLGLAGPKGKQKDLPGWQREWIESMKERVRVASGGKGGDAGSGRGAEGVQSGQ